MSKVKRKLKPEWELFCQYYAGTYETFGNATKSYARAYDKDLSDKSVYASCRTAGYRLLTNDDIIDRINVLLQDLILNETSVDAELGFLIFQRVDFSSKIQAIKEWNRLQARITDKVKVGIDNPLVEILKKYGGGSGEAIDELPETQGRPPKDNP